MPLNEWESDYEWIIKKVRGTNRKKGVTKIKDKRKSKEKTKYKNKRERGREREREREREKQWGKN